MTGPRKPRPTATAARRTAALVNIKKAWAAQRTYPRCNAIRRSDGGRCENLGTGAGGRCKYHGGATPKGKDWHKVQLTNPAGSVELSIKKQKEVARRRARQAARVAAMTPEERARYDAWHEARKPGGPEVRKAAAQAREVRAMLAARANAAPVETPEAKALREAIEALESQLEALKKPPARGPDTVDPFS